MTTGLTTHSAAIRAPAEAPRAEAPAPQPAPKPKRSRSSGPAKLFDFFAPHAMDEMARRNVPIKLVRSEVELRDENPNLRGAAVMAYERIQP